MDFKRDILPHLLVLFVFFVIVFTFFSPAFISGKVVSQHDIDQWKGGAQELREYREETGEEGLWTNSMFSGMPGHLVDIRYSGDWLVYVKSVVSIGLPNPADQIFTAMITFYVLLLVFGVRPWLAMIGAIAFAFNSFNIINIQAGHNMKGWAIAYTPLVLAGIHWALRKNLWQGIALTALALGMQIRFNHLQITYYLFLIVLIYGISELIFAAKENRLPELFKKGSLLLIAVLIAVGANFGKLWNVYEYGPNSIRGERLLEGESDIQGKKGLDKDYAFNWSGGIGESFTLLIPNLYGGPNSQDLGSDSNMAEALRKQGAPPAQIAEIVSNAPTYHGNQPFVAGPIYAGAIVVFLFVMAMLILPAHQRYWILAACIFGLALNWGKNFEAFNYFMFDYFPGYNKFRAVTMAMSIPLLLMPLAGFRALEQLLQQSAYFKNYQYKIAYAFIGTAVLSLAIAIIPSLVGVSSPIDARLQASGYPDWLIDALKKDRLALISKDAYRSFFLILLFAAAVYAYLHAKLKVSYLMAILLLLFLADHYLVGMRYLNDKHWVRSSDRSYFAASDADKLIKSENDTYQRVLNLQNPFNEARTSYHHASIGGYHGAKLRRYQDLIERQIDLEISKLTKSLQEGRDPSLIDLPVLNMLNTGFFKFGDQAQAVLPNENAFGNAWFVEQVKAVSSHEQEMQALQTVDLQKTAVIHTGDFPSVGTSYTKGSEIKLEAYRPGYWQYSVSTAHDALAVFSEIHYPQHWRITIDGDEVDMMRANYVLRALEIPAGSKEVVFEFLPNSYFIGNRIMMISNFILFGLVLFFIGKPAIKGLRK
ncbi:MAG: YfhO family protein [Cyclobacteriaceae bacterium]|nr:hypothetical protein [Cyclobacteriaceae bacterium]MCH8515712.1 YfhO family protein [Cyclobacteriaceae bacterium]